MATTLNAAERAELARLFSVERQVGELRRLRPGWFVDPHDRGQVQALCSPHTYRILIPGNGWGKTTCMALDVDLLMQRDDPFKPQVMPDADGEDRPTTAVWFCQKYQQWEIMQPDVEALLSRPYKWRSNQHYYEWPNGSRLFILSSDSDWAAIQGIELDAVYFDEHPDRKFWTEMLYRRRGKKKTRYMVAATMTQGITWFVTSVIQPWEEHCRSLGLTNDEAIRRQPHPTTFIWNVGGIHDNPSMTEADAAHYDSITVASEKERMVRRHGGYADFVGEAVFAIEPLQAMEAAASDGESGAFVFLPDERPELWQKIRPPGDPDSHAHRFWRVTDRQFFEWRSGLPVEGGRITIWDQPDPDEAGNYVIGADFAAGLVGKDYDTAMVGLKTADGQVRQVAEARGHWGDIFFAEVLFCLGVWYFEAFIVGERQFGLPCLRRLYDEMGYTYLYHQHAEGSRARRMSDLLGHHRAAGDTIIPNHRLAIQRQDVRLVSRDAIGEHKRYQFKPRRQTDLMDDVERSSDLITGAPAGEHDDLVMAAAYMLHGAREAVRFVRPKRAYRPGTFGDVMGLEETLRPKPAKIDPYAIQR